MSRRLTMRRRLGPAAQPVPDSREVRGFWVRLQRLEEDAFFWYQGGWYMWLGWEFNPDCVGHSRALDVDDLNHDTAVFVKDLKKVDTSWSDKPENGAIVVKHRVKPSPGICQWRDLQVGDQFNLDENGRPGRELFIKLGDNFAASDEQMIWREHNSTERVHYVKSILD